MQPIAMACGLVPGHRRAPERGAVLLFLRLGASREVFAHTGSTSEGYVLQFPRTLSVLIRTGAGVVVPTDCLLQTNQPRFRRSSTLAWELHSSLETPQVMLKNVNGAVYCSSR